MKIKPEHYLEMRLAIEGIASKLAAHREFLLSPKNPRPPKDIDMRLRWDAISFAKGDKWICDNLYPYANDDHIDTALRKIMAEIEVNQVKH